MELVAGLDRKIGTWNLTAHAKYGRNKNYTTTENNPIINRHYNAADAVVNPATGAIVCRSTLTQPNNGCVPINLLGNGSPSQQALDWILGTIQQDLTVKQKVAEATLSGELLQLPAGAVSVATGIGWRDESSDQVVDPISSSLKAFTGGFRGFPMALVGQLGGFDRGNPSAVAGGYDLREVFVEAGVPLLRDVAPGEIARPERCRPLQPTTAPAAASRAGKPVSPGSRSIRCACASRVHGTSAPRTCASCSPGASRGRPTSSIRSSPWGRRIAR